MKIQERIREPYLIQRLKKPYEVKGERSGLMAKLADAFSFGGGKINGGMDKKAYELISKIWRYDYMGSAEFEWGAVPESLAKIWELRKAKKLIRFEMPVTANAYDFKTDKGLTVTKTVYVVCNEDFKKEIQGYIEKLTLESAGLGFRTKENVCFGDSICGKEYRKDIVGWHDIDNHYLFFTDKEMFDNFCELFELK